MKTAVVSFSSLAQHDRMDAGFHILNQQYAEAAKALEASTNKDQIISFLSDEGSIPTSVLKLLAPLTRGSTSDPGRDQLLKAVRDYPFLSLAIIKDQGKAKLEEVQVALAKRATAAAASLHLLDEFGGPATPTGQAVKKFGPGRT